MSMGEKILKLRKEQGWSQEELADRVLGDLCALLILYDW